MVKHLARGTRGFEGIHRRWILAVIGVLACVGAMFAGMAWAGVLLSRGSEGLALAVGLSSLYGAPLGALILLAVAVNQWVKLYRRRRRARGRFTAHEREEIARRGESDEAWRGAAELAGRIERDEAPAPIEVWGLVPGPGEMFFFDVEARYERFYGTAQTYTHRSGFFAGHPALLVAGLAATVAANAASRASANARAATQWREVQSARVLASNQRLAIHANGTWLSFYFAHITACYPNPGEWSFVAEFEGTSPLRVSGPHVPLLCVWIVGAIYGRDGIRNHPGLEPLRRGAAVERIEEQ